ncbi:histidine phosphatase family protein [Sinorhizobium fredii]|uniref:histidine phosphatase family protein n=1 Tax=Rhizobium fredii TaxID=380 RepID=UPI001F32FB6F|nr:histidine phosphatase family protein [Sinorhizobium fredii]
MSSTFVIVRHRQSEGNERNEFTGWKDAPLSLKGRYESRQASERLAAIGSFSTRRSVILRETQGDRLELSQTEALNERDYGELTGMNKDEARKRWVCGAPLAPGHPVASATPAHELCTVLTLRGHSVAAEGANGNTCSSRELDEGSSFALETS